MFKIGVTEEKMKKNYKEQEIHFNIENKKTFSHIEKYSKKLIKKTKFKIYIHKK